MLGYVTGTRRYVELRTCLEMAIEAKKLPAGEDLLSAKRRHHAVQKAEARRVGGAPFCR